MKKKKLFLYLPHSFLVLFLIMGLLNILSLKEIDTLLILKIAFIYALLILLSLWYLIIEIHRTLFGFDSVLGVKYNNLENLLLDLRDGTKNFFSERRRFPRFKDDIHAMFVGEDKLIKVLDISSGGALLETEKGFKPKDSLQLRIYLPFFPQPITVKAKVARVADIKTDGVSKYRRVGIEFQEVNNSDKARLKETLRLLSKPRLSLSSA